MAATLDHLVIAGTDLSALVAWWAATAGEQPTAGGAHTGLGTRNALVGLGDTTYIELIGPDEQQADHVGARPFGINELEPNSIQLITFALAVDDIEAAAGVVRAAGIDPGPINAMSRVRPDGVELSWRLAVPPSKKLGGVMPFLLEWGPGTPHPAKSLHGGCSLERLSIAHPSPEPISEALAALGFDGSVESARVPTLSALLATPNGPLEL